MEPKDKRVVVKTLPTGEVRVRIFPTQAFINKHIRPYWRVDYIDGSSLTEILEDGSERDFKEINLAQVKQLHIIGRGNVQFLTPEYNVIIRQKKFDYFLDCRDGVFYFGDKFKSFLCSDLKLPYNKGLILYKEASVPIPTGSLEGMPPLEPRIEAICFGYKVKFGNKKYQVICKVKMDGSYSFNTQVTDLDNQVKKPLGSFGGCLSVRRKR
jgi:hypothetical protein